MLALVYLIGGKRFHSLQSVTSAKHAEVDLRGFGEWPPGWAWSPGVGGLGGSMGDPAFRRSPSVLFLT